MLSERTKPHFPGYPQQAAEDGLESGHVCSLRQMVKRIFQGITMNFHSFRSDPKAPLIAKGFFGDGTKPV